MSERSETVGEQVGSVVEAAVKETEQSSQAAIDEAKRKTDEAARTAEQLAQAAMHTELGTQIRNIDERTTKWLGEHEANKQTIASIQAGQTALAETLSRLSSSLETLTRSQTPITETTVVVPEKDKETSNSTKTEASEKSEGQTKPKRTRLFL